LRFRLTPEEMLLLENAAGDQPASVWVRELALKVAARIKKGTP